MAHEHSHSHHGHHHHHAGDAHTGRLIAAVAVNGLLTIAQIVGGVLSGSLSLVADALHNLGDAGGLVVALVARRLGQKPPDERHTFGRQRIEVVGALINTTALVIVAAYLAYQAIMRAFNPEPVHGGIMIGVAAVALAVDLATVLLTWRGARESLNIKAALLHNLSDAAGSVLVIAAGVLVARFGWYWADTAGTLLLAAWIGWQAVGVMRPAIHILVDRVPESVTYAQIDSAIRAVDEVSDVHHLHVRNLDEKRFAIEAHVVIPESSLVDLARIKEAIRATLLDRFGIDHSTLEMETDAETCEAGAAPACHRPVQPVR